MSEVPSFSLDARVIVQIGGTGLLGRSLVAALGAAGATLVVASRNRGTLESLAEEERASGRAVLVDDVDIGSESSLHGLRDRVLDQHGRVDGVVFNAVSRPMASMDDDLDRWRESMEVNATGFFATVRVFGAVVFLLSDASSYITGVNLPVDGGYTAK